MLLSCGKEDGCAANDWAGEWELESVLEGENCEFVSFPDKLIITAIEGDSVMQVNGAISIIDLEDCFGEIVEGILRKNGNEIEISDKGCTGIYK